MTIIKIYSWTSLSFKGEMRWGRRILGLTPRRTPHFLLPVSKGTIMFDDLAWTFTIFFYPFFPPALWKVEATQVLVFSIYSFRPIFYFPLKKKNLRPTTLDDTIVVPSLSSKKKTMCVVRFCDFTHSPYWCGASFLTTLWIFSIFLCAKEKEVKCSPLLPSQCKCVRMGNGPPGKNEVSKFY